MIIDGLISFYPCHDLAATRNFYQHELRLPLVRDQGSCLIFKVAAQAYLGFCQHQGALPKHPGLIITLLLDDVDSAYQQLCRLGIETEGRPRLNPRFAIYHFFARDPDGYRVELQRFVEPLAE